MSALVEGDGSGLTVLGGVVFALGFPGGVSLLWALCDWLIRGGE